MDNDNKSQRKHILQNPVTAYTTSYPNSVDLHLSEISALNQKLQSFKTEKKQMQEQCQKTSRNIGQAKRNNKPVDDLMHTMQAQSKNLKTVKNKITDFENNILAFFISQQAPIETETDSTQNERNTNNAEFNYDPNAISISLLKNEQDEWNDYVNNQPTASLYHRAEWCELIKQTHKHPGLYFTARNTEKKIIGILPLTHLKSRLFGNFIVSMPYFNYGGAIADHPLIEQQLMSAAADYAKKLTVNHIEYRDDTPRNNYPVRTDKVNMLLKLPLQDNELWSSFSPKLRAQIRRPQRENPEVLFGGKDLLDDFYTVFARNMRDLGTPVYGKQFFRKILQNFTKHSKIIVIRLKNKPVAAAFLLGHKGTLEIPWASTIKDVNHLSINMLMYWEVLKFAIHNQYQQFDFGRSSKDSGTYRFKQQWGAKPKQLYWHYWLPENCELPRLNPDNPKYTLAINIWKRIPVFITKLIGPYIVKNLP